MLGTIVGAAVAGLVIELMRRRTRRRRRVELDAGAAVEVPGKLRLLDESGLSGRWREGLLVRDGHQIVFRPRRPIVGRRVDLTSATVVGTRPKERLEFWWFAGPTVLVLTGPPGRFELAGGSDADIGLLGRFFDV